MKGKYPKEFNDLTNPFDMDDPKDIWKLISYLQNRESFRYALVKRCFPLLTPKIVIADCYERLEELNSDI